MKLRIRNNLRILRLRNVFYDPVISMYNSFTN